MATKSLIGNDNIQTGTDTLQRTRYLKFTATGTGNVTEIRVYGHAAGNVKVALFADSSGSPGTRLSYNNDSQAILANQWNTLTIPSVGIAQGTNYWLAIATDGTAGLRGSSTGGIQRYKTITYSTYSWPDPADSGLSSSTWLISIAGWGYIIYDETAKLQVALAVQGEADVKVLIETGKLQEVLAQIGISTVFNLLAVRNLPKARLLGSVRELEAL